MQDLDGLQGDGTGVMSIYDGHFPDENFIARHTGPGLLSMANSGRNQNGCQFFLTCAATPHLDGKHVVFGRVLEDGLKLVRKIEHISTDREKRPRIPVLIAQCGEM
jgi:peptidyl-prolyl isomerase H (cyclophilin H)